jgi:hypothetical protein
MSRNWIVIFSVGLLSLLLILGVPPVQAEGKSGEKAALYLPAPTGVRPLMVGTQIPPLILRPLADSHSTWVWQLPTNRR